VVPPEGKTLVYWGTPKVKASLEMNRWPAIYRARNELQEQEYVRDSCSCYFDHEPISRTYSFIAPRKGGDRSDRQDRPCWRMFGIR